MKWLQFVWALLLSSSLLAQSDPVRTAIGQPAGAALSGARLEQIADAAAARLRCPVCQGLSVNDSPATMAVNMKREVRDLAARGYSEEQILKYFEQAYGQFVLLDPPKRGINWIVWLLPALALLGGAFLIVRLNGRSRQLAVPADAPDVDESLRPYVERVRSIAFGTEGGER